MSFLDLGPLVECDRCAHPLRRHAGPPEVSSRCLVGARLSPDDPKRCICDGFVARPERVDVQEKAS